MGCSSSHALHGRVGVVAHGRHFVAPSLLRRSATCLSRQVAKRKAFEAAIKRPYFHFKPLDDAQLNNWRAYCCNINGWRISIV